MTKFLPEEGKAKSNLNLPKEDTIYFVDNSARVTLTPQETNITFTVGGKDMLVLKENGDIFVKGRLVENDKEVVEGFKEWLKQIRNFQL